MLNKRGALIVEYALLLALVIVVGINFTKHDYHELFTHPIIKIESLIEGKKDDATYEGFWDAIKSDKTSIFVGKQQYIGILDYITNANSNFTSGSIGTDFKGTLKPTVNGQTYDHASGPIHDILTSNNYLGHKDITWSVIGKHLYVYEKENLNLTDHKDKTFQVMCYDLTAHTPIAYETSAKFVKGAGNYGYLKPL